jgi:hypothetical protein
VSTSPRSANRPASADLVHAGALRGRRRVLAQHVARGERVGLLGQPAGPGEAIADLALGARAVLADARVGATALQQRIDRRTVQAVLARAGADLLRHVCVSTPYLLALAGLQRPVVGPLPRVQLLPDLRSGLARLPRACREVRQDVGRDVDELGRALDHRPPLQPEPLADLGAQMRLIEEPGVLGVRVELVAVQRRPPAVGPARDVGGGGRRRHLFGPEKIPEHLGAFLGYFMARKVIAGQELLRAPGTVTGKLVTWLAARGYIDRDLADHATGRRQDASRDLPVADRLGGLLHDVAARAPEIDVDALDDQDWVEDHLAISDVEPGRICFEGDIGPIAVPSQASDLARPGWSVSVTAARTKDSWHLLEVGFVYP